MPFQSQAETVTIVSNSNSGIEKANYTATLSDGTVLGFYNPGSSSGATFCGAISQKTSLSVPDSVIFYSTSSTNRYPVKVIGYNRLDFDNAQSITSLTLPSLVSSLSYMAPTVKTLHTKSYISSVTSSCLSGLSKVLVPSSTLSSYLGNSSWYNYVLINAEGTNPLKVTINMTKPGEFAQLLLQKTDDWKKVNELTVTGELNSDDLAIFTKMRQLTKLDLSNATITLIPSYFAGGSSSSNYGFGVLETLKLPSLDKIGDYAFQYCRRLKTVSIAKVKTIGQYAFQYCGMPSLTLPSGLTSIGSYAFQYSALQSVTIPNTMTKIESYCFRGCSSMSSATIPESVTTIDTYAFNATPLTSISLPGVQTINGSAFLNCNKLSKVTFAEGLHILTGSPFSGCTSLTEIDLPSTLYEVNDAAFKNCTGIKKVISRAVTAPTHGTGASLLSGCNMTDVQLYVPAMSIDTYRAQNGWKSFYTILPIEGKLTNVYIYDNETINDASQFENNCAFTLSWRSQTRNGVNAYYCGAVDYNGASTLSLGDYTQYQYLGSASSSNPYSNGEHLTSLIANGTIRANNVKTYLRTYSNTYWYFISLPYDVKVSDISYPEGTQFVIRKYSGLNRANQSTNTWLNLTADSIMHAYEGYILKTNNKDYPDFIFPAINNSNKNKIFEKGSAVVPLGEYLSEFEHNRS